MQHFVYQGLDARIEYGEDRYTHNHAEDAEQTAEYGNREDNPEAGKPRGVTENLRTEDIAVELLENDNQDAEVERLSGIHHQHKEGAWNTADPRTEEWDYVGHADNHAYQNCVRRAYDTCTDKADNAYDNGVHNLAAEETDKRAMDKAEIGDDLIACLAVKQGVDDLFRLPGKFLFAPQQVYGDDKADHKVPECLKHAEHT